MDIHSTASRKPAVAGTQGIRRLIGILKVLAAHHENGLRFVEIARACELEAPTVHRMLKALEQEHMIERDPRTRCYRLGSLAFELGIAAAPQFNLTALCAPSLARLAQETGDTAFLFIRRDNDAVCISRVQGTYPIQTPVVTVGSRQPLGVNAGGLALLLALDPAQSEAVVQAIAPRLGAYRDCDATDVLRALQRSRAAGYAVIGELAVPGVAAIGLPVRNRAGAPVAALTVAAISSRIDAVRQRELLPLLRREVAEVERLLYQH